MVKTEFGNFGGIFGNSDSEDGVGKKIGAKGLADFETNAEPEQFSKFPRLQTKYVKRQQTNLSVDVDQWMLTCLAQAVVTVNRAQEGMVDNNSLEVVGSTWTASRR